MVRIVPATFKSLAEAVASRPALSLREGRRAPAAGVADEDGPPEWLTGPFYRGTRGRARAAAESENTAGVPSRFRWVAQCLMLPVAKRFPAHFTLASRRRSSG